LQIQPRQGRVLVVAAVAWADLVVPAWEG
jgi:hypothetical protein